MKLRPAGILMLLILLAITVISCHSDRFFEQNHEITNGSWAAHNNLSFVVVITDTSALYDFSVNIRNDVTYPYSNLFLFLKTTFPNRESARDTIECLLAANDGRWLGSGMGSVRFNRFLFQQGVRFREPGTYRFDFVQAMRVDPLRGIRDVGIRIDKHAVRNQ